VQGPEKYLNELGITLPCAVDSTRPAIIDVAHRALVNYEAYFVADDAALKAFVAEPYRYAGKVTDPVSRARFVPTSRSPTRSQAGRLFYFESSETATTFDTDPMRYGTPMPTMHAKDQS